MDSRIAHLNRIAPRRIRVQAALWVTDLHGPNRDAALEARVRRWLTEDPRHAAAFSNWPRRLGNGAETFLPIYRRADAQGPPARP